jgi:hypothetical protein
MRSDIIARCFAVMTGALAFAWSFAVLAALGFVPELLLRGFYYVFFAGHFVASCAAAVAALVGIYMLIREPHVRRLRSYTIVGGAIVVCSILSFVTAAIPLP